MIKSVIIDNNDNLPLKYSYKLESLKNGTRFDFINGVNIIIGILSSILRRENFPAKIYNYRNLNTTIKPQK